jgi:hypothetical protein
VFAGVYKRPSRGFVSAWADESCAVNGAMRAQRRQQTETLACARCLYFGLCGKARGNATWANGGGSGMKRNSQTGQSILLVALALTVLLGMMGLAIDFGYYRFARRNMQLASDAAATAGAGELLVGDVKTAAQAAATKNGFSLSLTPSCAPDPGTISVNNPPCYSASDPHNGDSKYVEVVMNQSQPVFFSKIFGAGTVPIVTRSEAEQGGGANCIYALDQSGNPALAIDFLAALVSKCGIVDESANKTDALQCIFAAISASSIGVVGGVNSPGLCFSTPTIKTGIHTPSPADPLAGTPTPAVGACGLTQNSPYTGYPGLHSGLSITGTATLYPGVYCGGINLMPGANVTFNPGTYILTSPVSGSAYGLTVDLGVTAIGNGVTFYNTLSFGHASGGINFNFTSFTAGGVSLIAPTSGTYEGILFFQDPANTNTANIVGSSAINTVLQGTYYFPNAQVKFAFDGLAAYSILVAKDIDFEILTFSFGSIQSNFNNDYSSLANGSPVKGGAGVLVE